MPHLSPDVIYIVTHKRACAQISVCVGAGGWVGGASRTESVEGTERRKVEGEG